MKVLDLSCHFSHTFEGWFGSEQDFQDQLQRGLLTCPMCGDDHITKRLSAPRLNLLPQDHRSTPATRDAAQVAHPGHAVQHTDTGLTAHTPPEFPNTTHSSALSRAEQAVFMAALRHVVEYTEDVGREFPEQVRRMHHGEVEAKPIRGQASAAEVSALSDEGIEVLALPGLPEPKGTLQ